MRETLMYEVNIVYMVDEKPRNVLLQYKTREEAERVAKLHTIGEKEEIDTNVIGVVHDIWVVESLVKEKE